VAETFKIGPCTAHKIVAEMCEATWLALKDEFISAPSQTKWETIATDFWRLWNFPNCIGAIDGKHVLVRAPAQSGSLYFNYKRTHSIVLLAVDGGVFQESSFGRALLQGQLDLPRPKALPGTETVSSCHSWRCCFPPECEPDATISRYFNQSNLTSAQRVYNYRHCRARRIIENAFGIMASRFRILGRPIESSVGKAVSIVQACVALHNYLISTDVASAGKARYITPNLADAESNLVTFGRPTRSVRTQAATATRNALRDFF
uniref:DDE Tnp4 domain-containing protein n=1 Tax=Sinocyclocheilus rhinocerous TaxID=307959 RepID=A0A673L2A3_9TELE